MNRGLIYFWTFLLRILFSLQIIEIKYYRNKITENILLKRQQRNRFKDFEVTEHINISNAAEQRTESITIKATEKPFQGF